MLSDDERSRATQFRFERDRRSYILRHGRLRETLASYLGAPPERLRLVSGPHGKPFVEGEEIKFSLSHSRSLMLLAVAHGREVGCDIEHRHSDFPCNEVAEHFFSRSEARALNSLPAAQQAEAFFKTWTCKEAYLKARGYGLALPLDSVDIALTPNGGRLSGACAGWSVQVFEPALRYHAAVVAQGNDWHLNVRSLPTPALAASHPAS
nr:4'-phosphopantetheinyl transferase superfamily protein [Roseomonas sp. KE2513]